MKTSDLSLFLMQFLQVERFNDYCPNGLQIEGKPEIKKIVTGVTASYALLQAAYAENADAILVHHGYFWRGESLAVTGFKKRRLQFLLQHDINLFAYHLPLDAHLEIGNNAMLAKQLGLTITSWLSIDKNMPNMLAIVELNQSISLNHIVKNVHLKLNREAQVIGDLNQPIKKIALCTGAAQNFIEQAALAGADCYISGEISEQTVHVAREMGLSYIAAGHHATERYGIQALGEFLAHRFDLNHTFIDCDNPV
jgi:dinuclear metal center YbgI/SA1388 family protein